MVPHRNISRRAAKKVELRDISLLHGVHGKDV